MLDLTLGRVFRAVRLRHWLRQIDVAERAAVSQQTVSVIERGRLDEVDLITLRRVGSAIGIEVSFAARWRGPELDRLLDAGHAAIVELVVGELRAAGWTVEVEWSFSQFGERGAIDVLGWHPARRALVVIEVKTRIVDLQDLLGTLDRKVRIAGDVLPTERGWRPISIARIVVLPESSTSRDAVARHRATFEAVLPDRTLEARRWLREPAGTLRAVWFLRITDRARAPGRHAVTPQRVRVKTSALAGPPFRETSQAGRNRRTADCAPARLVSRD